MEESQEVDIIPQRIAGKFGFCPLCGDLNREPRKRNFVAFCSRCIKYRMDDCFVMKKEFDILFKDAKILLETNSQIDKEKDETKQKVLLLKKIIQDTNYCEDNEHNGCTCKIYFEKIDSIFPEFK